MKVTQFPVHTQFVQCAHDMHGPENFILGSLSAFICYVDKALGIYFPAVTISDGFQCIFNEVEHIYVYSYLRKKSRILFSRMKSTTWL